MSSLLDDGPAVQSDAPPFEPSAADWEWLCRQDRPGPADPAPVEPRLPVADWFACQVARFEHKSRATDDYHGLIATALNDVRCVLVELRVPSARALVARPGHTYSRLDLDAVAVPVEARGSHLATLLDEDAQYYLDLDTDLGRLAAGAILGLADQAERFGSRSVAEFLDDEAAWLESCRTAFDDIDNPLW